MSTNPTLTPDPNGDEHDYLVTTSESIWLEFPSGILLYIRQLDEKVIVEQFLKGDDLIGPERDGHTFTNDRS